MRKPLIGVPGRRKTGEQVDGFPESLHQLEMDVFLADYSRSILNAGGLPLNIPMDAEIDDYLEHLSGIVLTGGADIDPVAYEQEPDGNGGYEQERDVLELALLDGALTSDIPVLGICRGLQILNVHAGGTLHQDVPSHSRYDVAPSEAVHTVETAEGSWLREMFGESTEVNSLHHQTVDRLGNGLIVTAFSDDHTVEGIEMPGRRVVAVQWHPEMLTNSDPVFAWLIDQAMPY